MKRFNTIGSGTVPIFLCLLLAAGCGAVGGEESSDLSAEERFFVDEYLRVVEARLMASRGDSLAPGRFAYLETNLPSDSLRAIGRRLSEDPDRWVIVFEEIVRRKDILANEPR